MPTAGSLDLPSFRATVDHRAGAGGSAQQTLRALEEFRFEVIASKPSFILGELKATKLPVVFLDTDLEFYSFPHLFVPGSWPNGGRDVAIFNFWGNETDYPHASTPTTGSGVVFFNQVRVRVSSP